jgi:hypothetical protein
MTAPNTTSTPATGPTSTSWWLTVSAMLTSVLPFVWVQITHQAPSTQQVATVVGGVGAVVAFVTKIWHDLSRRKMAAAAPSLQASLDSKVLP